jgi:polysaccharide pyruvyl transferase WcaK-like protein
VEAKKFSVDDIKDINFSNKIVWIAFRSWYLNNEKILINKIIDFILEKWWKVILIPHSFHTVNDLSNDLKFLTQFIRLWVDITASMNETYSVYKEKKIDFCLSMRLHSMILSQVYSIPFVAIKYAKKRDLM